MAGRSRLTDRQVQFVNEYMIDLNATQAAIRAGYSPRSAGTDGPRLLENAGVRARIDAAIAERSRRTGVNADRVVRELARIAFASAPDFINMNNAALLDSAAADDRATISSIRVKRTTTEEGESIEREIRLADKIKALDLLGKHLGMFSQSVLVSGKDGGPVELEEKVHFYLPFNGRDGEVADQ